ncbi:MAG: M48 family metallopeptidase [Bacteroidales bacterium]|nr:M48 family metallopeptidase [Bacteroidales bacterium]
MKKFSWLFIVIVFVAACSTVAVSGRRQLLLVPESQVVALSAESYNDFMKTAQLSTDKANTALVKKVGSKLSAVVEQYLRENGKESDIANFSWEFSLVKDQQVNAFCMPGGKIVFYDGILPYTQNEAGIAVVMGHEIAHAVAKHSSERLSQQLLANYGASIATAATADKSAATQNTINTLYGLGAQYGVLLPYSRKHEYEADHIGLIFMKMAGYDPNEAIRFWERMSAGGSATVPEFLSTHPSDANRIAKMKEEISKL